MNAGMLRICLLSALLYVGGLARVCDGNAEQTAQGLRNALEVLADRHGFTITGADKLKDEAMPPESGGNLATQLESLLSGYNYVLQYDAAGAILKLSIVGPRPSAEELERRVGVQSTRRGNYHVVEATVVGPTGAERTLPFIVDTGASTMVLPSSMIEELGFRPDDLEDGQSQTAAGQVPVKLGMLHSVQVGHAHLRDVAVGFIEDEKLGQQNLLGMSFLGQFRLTLDDEANRVILSPR